MWIALFLMFVAVPLLELALLIKLGQSIGLWPTLAVILLTAGLGLAILQQQSFAAFRRASENLAQGKPPIEPVLDGFMLILAGGLLIAPGLLTDVAGMMLLIPPVRRWVAVWGLKRMHVSGSVHTSTWTHSNDGRQPRSGFPGSPRSSGGSTVIDGEFERVDEKSRGPKRDDRDLPRPGPSSAPRDL
jgi:UPF0716 protein FxsA